ncbi:unnamed protein product [Thlaspi arvense]|uniref:Kinesin motor domain-containing protein n=1 Tax=Thlaspi arvense TaxID=13288 RepID=A0AAU9RMM4_THLAR|nr:unnamed protein product [Thlaspi arvense]
MRGMTTEEDQMQGPSGCEEKIYVSVRLRPLNDKERLRNDVPDWECINNTTVIYRSHLSISERSMYPSAYAFDLILLSLPLDRVFGPDCCTRQVYEQGAKDVAFSVVSGVNASVFAYGQTSSGKTYTMSGITDCTLVDIYDYIDKHKEREFILKFSAMEIYNESVRDLLSTDSSPLRLLDDPEKGTVVEKLTEETLRDWNHFKELLSVCEAQRQIGETALNEVSSRSHQILRLTVESTAREFFTNDKFSTLTATVNFIDLAGSERASQSLSAGTRLKEGCHINRSLLTLGTVIRKLSKGKTGHIPFRDSKLTRILQSSLGGNARTAIICTMSPARIHVEQSRNTLLFASCAKEVTTNAQVNVVMSDKALVKHLQRELAKLESELRSPGQPPIASATTALLTEKDLEVEMLKKEVVQLAQELEQARSEIEDLRRMVGEERQRNKETLTRESVELNVLLEDQYPKLRVRSTWDSENTTPLSPISAHRSSLSPRSTEYSYDENVFQLSDFRIDSGSSSPFQQLAFVTPCPEVVLDIHGEENKAQSQVLIEEIPDQPHVQEERLSVMAEQTGENSEDNCREVRCIEMEKSDVTIHPEEKMPESSPDRYDVVNAEEPVCVTEPTNLRPPIEVEEDKEEEAEEEEEEEAEEDKEEEAEEVEEAEEEEEDEEGEEDEEEERVKQVSGASTQPKQESKIIKTPPCCGFKSSPDEFDTDMSNLSGNPMPPALITPSPVKRFSWDTERDPQPLRGMKLSRSRSCRASVLSSSSSSWFEKDADTPPSWYDKEFVKTAERNLVLCEIKNERLLQDEFGMATTWLERSLSDSQTGHAASHDVSKEMASPNESPYRPSDVSQTSGGASTREVQTEKTAAQKDKRIIHRSMEEIEHKFLALSATKSFKDAALDPIQDYLDTPLNWPEEFKRLQREIIELWHTCNVSMAHRSYFFLLFRGDQKDCLYLEVELRRLKYIRESFAPSSKAGDDGHNLTLISSSSTRALTRERFKLSKLMQRKLSKEERENLFLRWGIGLNTRHRRVQLAHRLWSDYKDMGHVRESASLVGKLHGFVDMNLTSTEMFGINFAFRPPRPKKSSLWKRSVLSLSFL